MSLWSSEGVTKPCYNLQECSALESGCLVKVDENGFFIYWKSEGKVIVYIFLLVSVCLLRFHVVVITSLFYIDWRVSSSQHWHMVWLSAPVCVVIIGLFKFLSTFRPSKLQWEMFLISWWYMCLSYKTAVKLLFPRWPGRPVRQ